ncbi:inactive serine protease PAMR1 [Thalassophryne amazonica]|uniref:inactive serine protease PAMR1 n=1 Tax=Thalassophryne amazonica TaxID=390379 RepID=UPI001471EFFC|nr:inactive serine protease PAMR1 [Thalassophryne amazonica]
MESDAARVFHLCSTAPPENSCPSSEWSVMCRPCCEYHLIRCQCPSQGSQVGYTVPCCRNALNQCDPCIFHPGCSLFENCKTCNNGTWKANDDFFVKGKYCTECRRGWSGGDCKLCGGVMQRSQGHITLQSYPTNARCEWKVRVSRGHRVELRFSLLSVESDHNCHYDYVEVRDGEELSSPVIGRFCGDSLPPPLKSSGNVVHILFVSDGYNNFDGFVLTFQEISAIRSPVCLPLEDLVNGYFLPIYGQREELVSVKYFCHPPFQLVGSKHRICLPNTTWSGMVPKCVPVPCAPPPKVMNGYHSSAPGAAGDQQPVQFFCNKPYILSGNHQSTCLSNGSWSSRPPKCVRACREPRVSALVQQEVVKPQFITRERPHQRLHFSSRYNIDDLLAVRFIPLKWDSQSERENYASEELPRRFHPVYTSIEYRCASLLYRLTGSSQRTCLKTGRWSGRHVSCSPVCGKFDTFSARNLTDIQWPWHVAIYITQAMTPLTFPSHQGASGETASWSLVCSGALLTQHSVLATGHCVLDRNRQRVLNPAQIKVAISFKSPTRNLRYFTVSQISLHPDSSVAVLKLHDKVKISERVLPVCLPRMHGGEETAHEAYTMRWASVFERHAPWSHSERVELADVGKCKGEFAGVHRGEIIDHMLCVKPSSPHFPCLKVIPGITSAPAVLSSTRGVPLEDEDVRGASSIVWQLLALETFFYEESSCLQESMFKVQTRIANVQGWIEENMK